MILWHSKRTYQNELRYPDEKLKMWRWVFEVDKSGISLNHYYSYMDSPNDWRLAGKYYNLCVTKFWHLGFSHNWYDGPHCSFSLGPIHYNWSPNDCAKCHKDGFDD